MSSNRIVVWTLAAFLLSFIAYWMLLLWSPEFHARWLQGDPGWWEALYKDRG